MDKNDPFGILEKMDKMKSESAQMKAINFMFFTMNKAIGCREEKYVCHNCYNNLLLEVEKTFNLKFTAACSKWERADK